MFIHIMEVEYRRTKHLSKTNVFRQLVFSTRESQKGV